jgi:hypothetical protein
MVMAFSGLHAQTAPAPFAVRGVLPWHNFLSGPSSWDLGDYEKYLDQCSAKKINFIGFHNYTGGGQRYATYVEPMIRIAYKNVLPEASFDNSLTARWGYAPRRVGDFAFGTARLFTDDSIAFGAECAIRAADNADRYRRAQALMRRVMSMAHARGMQTAMGFEFGVHPPEYFSIMEESSFWEGTGSMIPNPAHYQSVEILHATIDDIITAYPEVDHVWLWLNEHSFFGLDPALALRDTGFKALFDRDAVLFAGPGVDVRQQVTGVWSLAYLRRAYEHLRMVAPDKHMIIGGWGGSNQLPAILRGLDKALPVDVVFSCLNPGMGDYPQPAFIAAIAAHRKFWSIPWLEGDHQLWHAQPRVSIMRDQVKQAHTQHHDGVIAIHWRTEETRTTFEAFAHFASNPGDTSSVETLYRESLFRNCGPHASQELAGMFANADKEGWFRGASSPEYYAYTPAWGRLDSLSRGRLLALIDKLTHVAGRTTVPQHLGSVTWYIADIRFMLLLDEVGRKCEPAYALRKRSHASVKKLSAPSHAEVRAAREALAGAPIRELFAVYASRVRSRGELGVLSSLNQKLYNEYLDLQRFISTL